MLNIIKSYNYRNHKVIQSDYKILLMFLIEFSLSLRFTSKLLENVTLTLRWNSIKVVSF